MIMDAIVLHHAQTQLVVICVFVEMALDGMELAVWVSTHPC